MTRETAIVAVFGDLGRSPRMINHTRELIKSKFEVNLVGYDGDIDHEISSSPHVKLHLVYPFKLSAITKYSPEAAKYLNAFIVCLRVFLLGLNLMYIFTKLFILSKRSPKIMIIQTPPVLPLLLLSPIFCLISGTKLVVDWHNLGYTLVDKKHRILRFVYEKVELLLGRLIISLDNTRYTCVSESMKKWIIKKFNSKCDKVDVLYDRPNENYMILSEKERINNRQLFFNKFNIKDKDSLMFVSSTSWTPDEDFSILVDAIVKSDQQITQSNLNKKNIVLIITGKGAMRRQFEEKIAFMRLKNFKVFTVWLEPEAYPKLLSCADLGISLHTSSSGLDLPMKLVDMLGSGLPICAYSYECLSELVGKNEFGFLFRNASELSEIMTNISLGLESKKLSETRVKIASEKAVSWGEEWRNWFKGQIISNDYL